MSMLVTRGSICSSNPCRNTRPIHLESPRSFQNRRPENVKSRYTLGNHIAPESSDDNDHDDDKSRRGEARRGAPPSSTRAPPSMEGFVGRRGDEGEAATDALERRAMHRARFKAERRLPSRRRRRHRQPPSHPSPSPLSGHPTSARCTPSTSYRLMARCSMQLSLSLSAPLYPAPPCRSPTPLSSPSLSSHPESSEDAPSPRILTYFCGGGRDPRG